MHCLNVRAHCLKYHQRPVLFTFLPKAGVKANRSVCFSPGLTPLIAFNTANGPYKSSNEDFNYSSC